MNDNFVGQLMDITAQTFSGLNDEDWAKRKAELEVQWRKDQEAWKAMNYRVQTPDLECCHHCDHAGSAPGGGLECYKAPGTLNPVDPLGVCDEYRTPVVGRLPTMLEMCKEIQNENDEDDD